MAVDGTWEITVKTPMGAQKSTVVLNTDGGTLTGHQSGAQGGGDITDGTVDGNNVSWKAAVTSPMPMTLEFSGAVDGDSIAGQVKAGSFGSFPWDGSRTD